MFSRRYGFSDTRYELNMCFGALARILEPAHPQGDTLFTISPRDPFVLQRREKNTVALQKSSKKNREWTGRRSRTGTSNTRKDTFAKGLLPFAEEGSTELVSSSYTVLYRGSSILDRHLNFPSKYASAKAYVSIQASFGLELVIVDGHLGMVKAHGSGSRRAGIADT
jgi:hypothetical protein